MTPTIPSELHDFQPKRDFSVRIGRWNLFLTVFFTLLGLVAIVFLNVAIWAKWIFGIGLFLWFGLWTYFKLLLKTGVLATNWDNVDYTGIQKYDLPFTTSDGVKHFAYIYAPEGIDVNAVPTPLSTIIGLHGWGSHHREMDRYCLPTVLQTRCLYFTYDALGQGQTPGDKNDLSQLTHAREFIDHVATLSIVDPKKIIVVGMSLGAAKASFAAYPHPKVRGVVMLSGPFDLEFTKENMTFMERFLFFIGGFKLTSNKEILRKYSGLHEFKPEGVILEGDSVPTANKDRVLLLANQTDPTVKVHSTLEAIKILQLPPENYRIFQDGRHCFEGNEYFVSLQIFLFISKILAA